MPELDDILAVAVAAAKKAGAIQREKYGGILNVDAKLADDIKLEADRLCEKAIVDTIRGVFPSHAILAEESGGSSGDDHIWYVDPLDGTVNFYYGIPYFCTTVACYLRPGDAGTDLGTPLVGVTYAALTDHLFVAAKGRGTTLNGVVVRVREEPSLGEALVITAFGNSPKKLAFTRAVTEPLSSRIRKTRGLGACAYDLSLVAAGRASAFYECGVKAWDMAAGRILVEEAGGRFFGRPIGGGNWAIAASGQHIHDELAGLVNEGVDKAMALS